MSGSLSSPISSPRVKQTALSTWRSETPKVRSSHSPFRATRSVGTATLGRSVRWRLVWISRESVLRQLVPHGPRLDERVVLRPDPGVAAERAEPNRDHRPVRPAPAEEARSADRAEDLAPGVGRGHVDAEQLLPGEETNVLTRDPALRLAEGSRVLAAARAVTVVRAAKRRRDLEPDAAAEAASLERRVHDRDCIGTTHGVAVATAHIVLIRARDACGNACIAFCFSPLRSPSSPRP